MPIIMCNAFPVQDLSLDSQPSFSEGPYSDNRSFKSVII